jgi:hypothetical protein
MSTKRLAAILTIFFISAILFLGAGNMTEEPSVVKRIDHILLTPEDPRGLYDFMTQELKMPVAWSFREYEGFASGGVFFGNVNLEALVMNRDSLSTPSMIAGIAFEPAGPTDEVVEEIKRRQIAHDKPRTYEFGPEQSKIKMWTTTILTDFLPGSVVFICEYHPGIFNPPAWRKSLQKQLLEIKGGPLGIEYVKEVELRVKDREKALQKWKNLLKPHSYSPDGCFNIGNGPRLYMVESDKDYIHSIKIKVKSLDDAREFLSSRGLMGQDKKDSITLNPEKTFGVLFEILEVE